MAPGHQPRGRAAGQAVASWTGLGALVEAGLGSPEDAVSIARAGLGSLHGRMQVRGSSGEERTLADWPGGVGDFEEVEVTGPADPLEELVLPYRGDRLRGDAIRRQVDSWVEAGVVEPTVADAVGAVLANPDWLHLDGHTVAVIGAASEMGPLRALTRWGARVAAIGRGRGVCGEADTEGRQADGEAGEGGRGAAGQGCPRRAPVRRCCC